jgi:hypothetical protein
MGEAIPSPESLPGIVKRQKLSTTQTEVITQGPRWYDFRAVYNRLCTKLEADNERILDELRQVEAENEIWRAKEASDRAERAVKLVLSGNGEAQKN